jgi:hypothetical protein
MRFCATPSSPTCTSSASDGSAARHRSRWSTSPPPYSAAALLGLARGWGRGIGRTALLACAPAEQHDLGLLAFGLALRTRGWRIVYLGADTPVSSVADTAASGDPALVVVSAVDGRAFRPCIADLRELAHRFNLSLGGAGAGDSGLDVDVPRLTGDPVEEAEQLTRLARR